MYIEATEFLMTKSIKTSKNKTYKHAKLILLFSVTFVATLLLVSALIKNFSPTVDVNIGKEEIVQEDDTEETNERGIDDRLKWIQFEDNFAESPVVNEVQNADEKVNKKNKNSAKNIAKAKEEKKNKYIRMAEEEEEPPIPVRYNPKAVAPAVSEIQKPPVTPATKITKVYIGFYSSAEEATEIKNKLASSVGGYQPFVKKINNNYIVQIGSFTDRTKAVNLKLELSDKGYPARLLTE